MSTAQINARIDSAVKESGDRALANAGYSPTRAIRALWEFAGKNGHDAKRLRDLLAELEGNSSGSDIDAEAYRRMELAKNGPRIIERALEEMGIENHEPSGLSYDELREQAYLEKWTERGLV